jgi:PiT family inorganic phosphate transporter
VLLGTAVAKTIAGTITVDPGQTVVTIGAALSAAVAWNLVTWWRGLPSSSGHALLGGLVGAAVAVHGRGAVNWGGMDGLVPSGVIGVAIVLTLAPVFGGAAGFVVDRVLRTALRRGTRRFRGPVRGGQWCMSECLAISHGANDAQKAVGVVAALLVATNHEETLQAPLWVILLCGVALTAGTVVGGWPIVRTLGRRIALLRPADALASQSGSTFVLVGASIVGAPVSTTQVVASSVVGVGGGRRRWRHIHWRVVEVMVLSWLVTAPVTAILAAIATGPWRWLT